jgi:hypothetical protein
MNPRQSLNQWCPGMLITAICVRRSLPTECCQSKNVFAQREIYSDAGICCPSVDQQCQKRMEMDQRVEYVSRVEEPVRQDWNMQ